MLSYEITPINENQLKNSLIAAIVSLPTLLSEKSDTLFKQYPGETPIGNIYEGPITPHIAVIGSFFSNSLIFVVAENKLLIEASDFLHAVAALIAAYYCCNIEYPVPGHAVYQFLELRLLKVQYQKSPSRKVITLIDEVTKL